MQRVHVDHFKLSNGLYVPFLEDGREVLLCPQPGAQEAFLAAPEKEVCLAGPRGPGKTLILLSDYLQDVGAGVFQRVGEPERFRHVIGQICEHPLSCWRAVKRS